MQTVIYNRDGSMSFAEELFNGETEEIIDISPKGFNIQTEETSELNPDVDFAFENLDNREDQLDYRNEEF